MARYAQEPTALTARETPARPPTWESDVLVPLGQSFFLALTVALAGAVVAGLLARQSGDSLWVWAGGAALALFPLTWALAYVSILRDQRATLWAIETWAGRDLDGDGAVGRPRDRIVLVNPPPVENSETRTLREFSEFVRGCAMDTGARRWEPKIGRQKYQEWRDALIRMRYAEWIDPDNPKRGWRLCAPVETILRSLEV